MATSKVKTRRVQVTTETVTNQVVLTLSEDEAVELSRFLYDYRHLLVDARGRQLRDIHAALDDAGVSWSDNSIIWSP